MFDGSAPYNFNKPPKPSEVFKPHTELEIQQIARQRIDKLREEIRDTKEEHLIGWNSRGLS